MPQLVLGTGNRKKAAELVDLLVPLGFELQTLADYPQAVSVVESGQTFADNARLKAAEQAKVLKRWVLGEDSGLAVDALDGAPGVYSARFSGDAASDESNNALLLEKLGQTPLEQRTAHYVCHLALADPAGQVLAESEARCNGRIRFQPAGTAGFGYDPLFEIVEYHRTFAELGETVKRALSHRARAVQLLLPQLVRLVVR
jgi:XTP/dITP diphosphohydrolase